MLSTYADFRHATALVAESGVPGQPANEKWYPATGGPTLASAGGPAAS